MVGKIGIMDDDPQEVVTIENFITDREEFDEYEVEAVRSPTQIVQYVKENKPDLVLLDYVIDKVDDPNYKNGLDAAKHIRSINPNTRIALVTAQAGMDAAIEAIRHGYLDSWVQKSKLNDDLESEMQRLLSEYNDRQSQVKTGLIGKRPLITGATGFLMPEYVKALMDEDPELRPVLVGRGKKGKKGKTFQQRVADYIDMDAYGDRLTFAEGDITKMNLALQDSDLDIVLSEVDEVIHGAGLTDFDESQDTQDRVYDINVQGTRNVIELARKISNLKNFVQVSSAYMHGKRFGDEVAREEIATPKAGFRNPYESSKMDGSLEVINSGLRSYTIMAPSIIVGDSQTGMSDDKTIYGGMIAFQLAIRAEERAAKKEGREPNYHFRVKGDPDCTKNLICIDDCVTAMTRIRNSDQGYNKIFHVTNPEATTTVKDVYDAISGALKITYEFVPEWPGKEEATPGEDFMQLILERYGNYLTLPDARFDMTNTNNVIGDHEITKATPELTHFLLNKYAQRKQWGRYAPKQQEQ